MERPHVTPEWTWDLKHKLCTSTLYSVLSAGVPFVASPLFFPPQVFPPHLFFATEPFSPPLLASLVTPARFLLTGLNPQ